MKNYHDYLRISRKIPSKTIKVGEDKDLLIHVFDEKHIAIIDAYRDNVLILSSDIPLREFKSLIKLIIQAFKYMDA